MSFWLPFTPSLAPLLPALAPLWTHNDLHASNLFWSDAGPSESHAHATAIIDFGLADRTNAVHDIAHAIERNIVEWLALVNDPAHPDDVPDPFRPSRRLFSTATNRSARSRARSPPLSRP